MRLEDRPEAALRADPLARGGDRGTHFGRVVAVVVVDRHARSIGDQLHPAPGSGERPQPIGEGVEVGAEVARERQGRGRVEDVVGAGKA